MPTSSPAEFNTIITMMGMLCAMVQLLTGFYAFYYKNKKYILKSNDILFHAHRAFGSFATAFYFLGLFAGLSGFLGSLLFFGSPDFPPVEPTDPSYLIHVISSFPVLIVVLIKTYLSYFRKKTLYKRLKWLGIAMWTAWAITWITAAISYYLRTVPPNLQHPPPLFLLPFNLAWLQILTPFVLGSLIGLLIVWRANKLQIKTEIEKSNPTT